MIANASNLSLAESRRLAELESVVDAGLNTFVEVGNALMEIQAKELHRGVTFEVYCRNRFQIGRQRAYALMEAAKVVGNLSEISDTPIRESHAAELASLPAAEQGPAFAEAVATAPEGKVTAKHVAEVVARRKADDPDPFEDDGEESGADFAANAPLRALEAAGGAKMKHQPASRGSFDDAAVMMEAFKQIEETLKPVERMKPKKTMATEVAGMARKLGVRFEKLAQHIEKGF